MAAQYHCLSAAPAGWRSVQFAPESGFGWVILANREYAPLQKISHRVMGMLAHTP